MGEDCKVAVHNNTLLSQWRLKELIDLFVSDDPKEISLHHPQGEVSKAHKQKS